LHCSQRHYQRHYLREDRYIMEEIPIVGLCKVSSIAKRRWGGHLSNPLAIRDVHRHSSRLDRHGKATYLGRALELQPREKLKKVWRKIMSKISVQFQIYYCHIDTET
jgi:hypothetical protein